MTRGDLKNIRSLKQLEKAHLEITNDLNRCQFAIRKDINGVQKMFQPAHLFNTGWHLMAPSSPTPGQMLLGVVRKLKKRLQNV